MSHLAVCAFQNGYRGGRERTGNAVAAKPGSLVSVAFLTGDRWFESFSPAESRVGTRLPPPRAAVWQSALPSAWRAYNVRADYIITGLFARIPELKPFRPNERRYQLLIFAQEAVVRRAQHVVDSDAVVGERNQSTPIKMPDPRSVARPSKTGQITRYRTWTRSRLSYS
jgi:hypothetical protein